MPSQSPFQATTMAPSDRDQYTETRHYSRSPVGVGVGVGVVPTDSVQQKNPIPMTRQAQNKPQPSAPLLSGSVDVVRGFVSVPGASTPFGRTELNQSFTGNHNGDNCVQMVDCMIPATATPSDAALSVSTSVTSNIPDEGRQHQRSLDSLGMPFRSTLDETGLMSASFDDGNSLGGLPTNEFSTNEMLGHFLDSSCVDEFADDIFADEEEV